MAVPPLTAGRAHLPPGKHSKSCYLLLLALFLRLAGTAELGWSQSLGNGGDQEGTILLNQTNSWTFSATVGDTLVIRSGRLTGDANFNPWLRLFDPSGALVASTASGTTAVASELALTAAGTGTYTLLVSDSTFGLTNDRGTYRLQLVRLPGALATAEEGGPMTNGANHDGTISIGDLDAWTFEAEPGDRIILRSGKQGGAANFSPWMRLYSPEGELIADSGSANARGAQEFALTITRSGLHTLLVTDGTFGGADDTGSYRLHYLKLPGAPLVADEGGPLLNGGAQDGTITTGDLDPWTFSGQVGDRILLRSGKVGGQANFNPWIRLFSSTGELLADTGAANVAEATEIALTLTQSGIFTAVVTDSTSGGPEDQGSYRLFFIQLPGAPAVSDEGGALANGAQNEATLTVGDLDPWTFNGSVGDLVVLRSARLGGEQNFNPWMRVYDSSGSLIGDSGAASFAVASEIVLRLDHAGTFTLVIADSNSGGGGNQGNYRIYLAQVPGTIAPSDDGGRLVSGVAAAAQIQVGDLDVWQVFACRGSAIHLQLDRITNSNNFDPLLEIYDPAGRLLLSRIAPPSATADILANQGGIYTFLVRDSASGGYNGTGDYKITATGILSDEVQLCQPLVREEGIELAGIGGMPNAEFILFTSPRLDVPRVQWTPLLTNRFDPSGVFLLTNRPSTLEPRRYYYLLQP